MRIVDALDSVILTFKIHGFKEGIENNFIKIILLLLGADSATIYFHSPKRSYESKMVVGL